MVPPVREPLDPALRARLLQESRTPWRGLRRALWLAFTASAGLGLATMAMRASAGESVAGSDLLIQVVALGLFGTLLWRDRNPVIDSAVDSGGAD
jgi:Low psii accumulation1 / Rep27